MAAICILIVDDEATLLKNMAQSLRRDGFDVLTALNCVDARDTLSRRHVDALCLDVNLPDCDGLELLEEIRKTNPNLPTIVISGRASEKNESRAAHLGARRFLRKPFQLSELKSTLANFFETTENKDTPVG